MACSRQHGTGNRRLGAYQCCCHGAHTPTPTYLLVMRCIAAANAVQCAHADMTAYCVNTKRTCRAVGRSQTQANICERRSTSLSVFVLQQDAVALREPTCQALSVKSFWVIFLLPGASALTTTLKQRPAGLHMHQHGHVGCTREGMRFVLCQAVARKYHPIPTSPLPQWMPNCARTAVAAMRQAATPFYHLLCLHRGRVMLSSCYDHGAQPTPPIPCA